MASFEVKLKDGTVEIIEGADAYQPDGQFTTFFALGDSAERVVFENGLAGAARSCEILGRPAPNFSHRGLYGAYRGWYLNVSHSDDFLLAHLEEGRNAVDCWSVRMASIRSAEILAVWRRSDVDENQRVRQPPAAA